MDMVCNDVYPRNGAYEDIIFHQSQCPMILSIRPDETICCCKSINLSISHVISDAVYSLDWQMNVFTIDYYRLVYTVIEMITDTEQINLYNFLLSASYRENGG